MTSEVFFVNHPEMLLIGQHNGEIVALDTPANFNRCHGRYAHTKIRPLHRGELIFTGRQDGPHLQPSRNEFGHQVFDISEIGLLTLVTSLQYRTGKPVRVASLFERYEQVYHRACAFLKAVAESFQRRDAIAAVVDEIANAAAARHEAPR